MQSAPLCPCVPSCPLLLALLILCWRMGLSFPVWLELESGIAVLSSPMTPGAGRPVRADPAATWGACARKEK